MGVFRRTTCTSIIAALVLIGGVVYAQLKMQASAYDDAYIHFRIAENLITYGVPYYNPSEAVMVSSSSGWTLILAGLGMVARISPFLNLPTITAVFNGIVTGTGALVYLRLLRRSHAYPRRIIVEIFFGVAYLSQMIKPSLGLMETPFAILLAGFTLLALISNKPYSFILLGMLPFFRPELALVTVLGLVYAHITQGTGIKGWATTILGALPFIIVNLLFFGSLIPNTLRVKSTIYSIGLAGTLSEFISKIIDDIYWLRGVLSLSNFLLILYAFLVLTSITSCLTIFIYKQVRKPGSASHQIIRSPFMLFILWSLGTLGVYIASHVKLFTWYEPLYLIPGLLALCIALHSFNPRVERLIAIALLLSQAIGLVEIMLAVLVHPVIYQDFGETARVRRYMTVGKALYTCFPNARLMTSEIGGLGYTFRGQVLDGGGLASPQALEFHPMSVPEERSSGSIGAIPVGFIQAEQPEIMVSYDVFIEAFLRSPAVQQYQRYQIPILNEEDYSASGIRDIWGSPALSVFIRNDFLASERDGCPTLGITP